MNSPGKKFNTKQLWFQELFIGTLIYVLVLGLCNDYTSFVQAKSFSTILFASIVLEILTFLAFQLKNTIIAWLRDKQAVIYRLLIFFCVWMVMFVSKFVFIIALDLLFGSYITIEGFFGILFVVVSVTAIHKLAYKVFYSLGASK